MSPIFARTFSIVIIIEKQSIMFRKPSSGETINLREKNWPNK